MNDERAGLVVGIVGIVVGILIGLAASASFREAHAAPVEDRTAEAVIAATDDGWVLRRLEACDRICGPVPFEVQASRDSIRCTCARPGRITVSKVPRLTEAP